MSVAQSIRRKIHRFRQPDIVGQIVRGSSSALVINTAGQAIAALMTVVLARLMGKEMYGTYRLIITWVTTLAVPVGLGLPLSAVRILPEYAVKEDWRRYNGAVRCFQWLTLGLGIAVAAIGTVVLLVLNNHHEALTHRGLSYAAPFIVGLWMIPLVAQSSLISSISRAMRRVILAFGPPKIVQPLVIIATAVVLRHTVRHVAAEPVMLISAASMLLLILGQTVIYRRDLAKTSMNAAPTYQTADWIKFTSPFLVMACCQIVFVNAGTLVVGKMMHVRDVADYGVANSLMFVISVFLFASNVVLGPEVSALHASGDIKRLQQAVSTTVKLSFYPAAAATAVLLLFGKVILIRVFGPGYAEAYPTLVALSIGCLVATAAGPTLLLMNMTGFEKLALRVCLIAAAGYVIGSAIGVALLGYLGAGIGCAVVQAAWNICLCVLAKKHIGVNTSILRIGRIKEQPNAT